MRKLVAGILSACVLAAPVAVADSAEASVRGCKGRVWLKVDPWPESITWTVPVPDRPIPVEVEQMRLVGTVGYWWCWPKKYRWDKRLRPIWVEWCWTYIGSSPRGWEKPSYFFDKVVFKAAFIDNYNAHSPSSHTVKDDNTGQNCSRQTFFDPSTKWFRPRYNATWAIKAKVVLKHMKDIPVQFHWNGVPWKKFNPRNDLSLEGPFKVIP